MDHPIFSHYQTHPLTENASALKTDLSLDLGLTTTNVTRCQNGWQLPEGRVLTFSHINQINAGDTSCFQLIEGELSKVEAFSSITNRYYSLMPTPKAPTMLISGIPMHRIKGITPEEDTAQKIKALGTPYGDILDTATGLGYTAIRAARTAFRVITIEFDPAVLAICRANPWSRALFTNPNINQLIGDSWDLAFSFADATFNAIIHDPPTFSLAGHLYSQTIYDNFYRILKENGRLYHYIGDPNSSYGARTRRGVVNRLRQAGFDVLPKESAFGLLAKKAK